MNWLFFALLSPLLFAIAILIDDHLLRTAYKGAMAGAIISGFFGVIPATLILVTGHATELPRQLILISLLGGIAVIVGYYLYFKALQDEEPSVVSALMCVSPAIIPFVAYFLVDERLSAVAYVGFAIVVVAGFLYSLTDIKKFTISKSLVSVLLAGLIFDGVSVANKYVYTKADFLAAYFFFSIGIILGGILFLGILQTMHGNNQIKNVFTKNTTKILILLATAESIVLTAGFAADKATSLGSVSAVKALANTQPVYVLGLALLLYPFFPKFFREAKTGRIRIKFALLAVIVFGAFLSVQ